MAKVIKLVDIRRIAYSTPSAAKDPERIEIFPGVSLAELWRIWAVREDARRRGGREEDAKPTRCLG